jgi:hypothetical protein
MNLFKNLLGGKTHPLHVPKSREQLLLDNKALRKKVRNQKTQLKQLNTALIKKNQLLDKLKKDKEVLQDGVRVAFEGLKNPLLDKGEDTKGPSITLTGMVS